MGNETACQNLNYNVAIVTDLVVNLYCVALNTNYLPVSGRNGPEQKRI